MSCSISCACLSIMLSILRLSCAFSASRRCFICSSLSCWKCFSILFFSFPMSPPNSPTNYSPKSNYNLKSVVYLLCLNPMFTSASANWFDNIMINHGISLKVTMFTETFLVIFGNLTSWYLVTSGWQYPFDDNYFVANPGDLSCHVMTYHEFSWRVTNFFREVKCLINWWQESSHVRHLQLITQ